MFSTFGVRIVSLVLQMAAVGGAEIPRFADGEPDRV